MKHDKVVLIAGGASVMYGSVMVSLKASESTERGGLCRAVATANGDPTSNSLDVAGFIDDRTAEHHKLLAGSRVTNLRALAALAAKANPHIPDLAAMDHTIATFCNDLRECFDREESMVFPALLRLQTQTRVSRCQAGMVRARLRFMVAEQDAVLGLLSGAGDIARRHLSPTGPCESCHQLLLAIESLQAGLHAHVAREQDELFAWALAREDALIAQIADESHRPLV